MSGGYWLGIGKAQELERAMIQELRREAVRAERATGMPNVPMRGSSCIVHKPEGQFRVLYSRHYCVAPAGWNGLKKVVEQLLEMTPGTAVNWKCPDCGMPLAPYLPPLAPAAKEPV